MKEPQIGYIGIYRGRKAEWKTYYRGGTSC